MDLKEMIFKLCAESGVSGREYNAADKAAELMAEYADVSRDINGNVFAVMGKDNGKNILVDAHIDQIGFVVTKINDKGFVKLGSVGGCDMRVVNDTLLNIHGKETVKAVVCCLPPHLTDGSEDKAIPEKKLWADTGLKGDKLKSIVEIGDSVTFAQKPMELLSTKISSPALDDRCAVAALIRCAELLSACKLQNKVTFLFSTKEEVGGMGAQTASFAADACEAISVDVSFSAQPGVVEDCAATLGNGPMIGMSPVLNKEMTLDLINLAKQHDIGYQLEVMGGKTGTNADNICISKGGIKTALLSIPQKNMHTPAEIIDTKDVEATAQLIFKYITKIFDKKDVK